MADPRGKNSHLAILANAGGTRLFFKCGLCGRKHIQAHHQRVKCELVTDALKKKKEVPEMGLNEVDPRLTKKQMLTDNNCGVESC